MNTGYSTPDRVPRNKVQAENRKIANKCAEMRRHRDFSQGCETGGNLQERNDHLCAVSSWSPQFLGQNPVGVVKDLCNAVDRQLSSPFSRSVFTSLRDTRARLFGQLFFSQGLVVQQAQSALRQTRTE